MHEYMDFVFSKGQKQKTDATPHEVFAIPLAMDGSNTKENRFYMNSTDWIWAAFLAMKFFSTLTISRHGWKHAKWVVRNIPADDTEHRKAVMDLCENFFSVHPNSRTPVTLYHVSGKTATGNLKQLQEQTGLEYNRVRDAVNRRRYVNGWCKDIEDAIEGRRKPGPKKKEEKKAETPAPPPPPKTKAEESINFLESGL